MENRREFLKKGALAAAAAPLLATACKSGPQGDKYGIDPDPSVESQLIVPKGAGLPITGTFLDEISHDIPHQNWGEREWDRDFRYMKAIGIDTVIDIRCGYRKFITYPSPYLLKKGCYMPSVDLIDMFCRLAEKHGMKFMLGLYDSGKYWDTGDMSYEVESNKFVIDEVWERYGSKYKSFGGWYISGEISRATKGAIESFRTMGRQCKEISGGLPTFISPWIDGKKAVDAASGQLTKEQAVSVEQHEKEWNEIFDGIHEYVDACAFQDGHIDYDELDAFFSVNPGRAHRLRRAGRLLQREQEARGPLRDAVLDQRRDLRPGHAHPLLPAEVRQAPPQAGGGEALRLRQGHHLRVLPLHEPPVGLPPGRPSVRPI